MSTEGKCPDFFSLIISGDCLGTTFSLTIKSAVSHVWIWVSLHAWFSIMISIASPKICRFHSKLFRQALQFDSPLPLSPQIARITENVRHTIINSKWLYRIKSSIINSKIKSIQWCEWTNIYVQLCAISTFCRSDN